MASDAMSGPRIMRLRTTLYGAPPVPAVAPDGLLDRAAALAGAGAWSCNLADEALSWTSGVYDLFGLPRNVGIDRRAIVAMYEEESREAMERLRAAAIARQGTFTCDAQIVRTDGERRWMRLTGTVACRAGRPFQLYGLKQDITEEKARWEAMRRLAEQDALTGLTSRGIFQSQFLDPPPSARAIAPLGALILFDVDGFKLINDRRGHAAGDACLKAVAARLSAGFPDALMIARIGGDEFGVLTAASASPAALERKVARELVSLSAPILWRDQILEVSASAGIAVAGNPLAYDAEELFASADAALYGAKRAGRNRVRMAALQGAPPAKVRL